MRSYRRRIIALGCVAVGLGLLPATGVRAAAAPAFREIDLWPEGVPAPAANPGTPPEVFQNNSYLNVQHPKLVVYPPAAGTANGTGVIYCPGGGYSQVMIGRPQDLTGPFAPFLNAWGVTVFALVYRNAAYGEPAPLQDVLRAVRYVRAHAVELGVDPHRLGVLGNSAGSHVAASAGTLYDDPIGKTGAPLDAVSARPDFMILTFSVITMEPPYVHLDSRNSLLGPNPSQELIDHYSLEKHVTKDTPPTFLVHTMEDTTVPEENTLLFYEALRKAGVPAELHLYEKGQHGSAVREPPPTGEWPDRLHEWMSFHGWIPKAMAPAA